MKTFKDLIKKYQDTFLPTGRISLFTSEELSDNPLYLQLFVNTKPKNIVIEKEESVSLLSKVNTELFLEIEGDTDKTNIGVIKNLAKRITSELRELSITVTK